MVQTARISASLRTDVGRVRDHNEDFFASNEPRNLQEEAQNGWLYILADGAGGMDAGEIASQQGTERTLYHYLENKKERDLGQRLVQAMHAANADLRDLMARQENGNSRMATTMVATVISDNRVSIANVGDSRCYHFRNGAIQQITKDQSLVAKLLEEGAITAEEAAVHPRRNVILSSLGSEVEAQIDLYFQDLLPGDMLLLCSDGLTGHVADDEIAMIIGEQSLEDAPQALIDLANSRGGHDNISVILIHYLAHSKAKLKSKSQAAARKSSQSTEVPASQWRYTAALCLVQTVLTLLVWLLLRV